MPEANVGYALLSETFLQCLTAKFSEEEQIPQGREAIDYFTQYFSDGEKIQIVYESKLDSARFEYETERANKIEVNAAFCFRKTKASIELDFLWDLAMWMYEQKGKNI